MQFDSELVGGSSEGNAASGGRARERGAAEEDVGAERRLRHRVAQARKPLPAIDALIRQRPVERAAAGQRLHWRGFLSVLRGGSS